MDNGIKATHKILCGNLISYGNKIDTIFQLFGTDENAITQSLSWVLSRCPEFNKCIINKIFGEIYFSNEYIVYYQRYTSTNGITDIEITDNENYHIIIEAKRGWNLPQFQQLKKYAEKSDFVKNNAVNKIIVTMSECSAEYAESNLPKEINGITIKHMSWRDVFDCAKKAKKNSDNAGKKMLDELCRYLEGVIGMQNYLSNEVYCVSLSKATVSENSSLRWLDIVTEYGKYFCPQGNGWLVEPPNYIAFRYDGRVQSIHHIESYVITKNIHKYISGYPDFQEKIPHFVFTLGKAIIPSKCVKSGSTIRARRVWAMIDLLLTCDSVDEAVKKTKERKCITNKYEIINTDSQDTQQWNTEQYIDYSNVSPKAKMVWQTKAGELIKNPIYREAVNSYRDTLEDDIAIRGFDSSTFEGMEYLMITNMGGGLPIEGFYEMKEKIFEIADEND